MIDIDDIKCINLTEDDVLVIQISDKISHIRFEKTARTFKDSIDEHFPFDVKVMAIPSSVKIFKISGEDATVLKLKGDVDHNTDK